MPTKLSIFSEKVIEACWLVSLISTPLFFNLYSHRVFEPDKLSLLRSMVLIMALAWIIRFTESRAGHDLPEVPGIQKSNWMEKIWTTPFILPALLLAGSYLLSTLLSVVPRISLWGSYTRWQGTFTLGSYLIVFFSILAMMRRWEQFDRLLAMLILISLPVSVYGILQHFHLDPLPWGGEGAVEVPQRVVSTMGNSIFLGAYLIMVAPVTLARIVELFKGFLEQEQKSILHPLLISLYTFILILQLLCLLFTQSRGPWLGFMGGLYFFIFLPLLHLRRKAESQGQIKGREVVKAAVFALLSFPIGILPAYFFLIFWKRGFRWLWLGWVFHTVVLGGILVLLVWPQSPLSSFGKTPFPGRLVQLSDTQAGTARVRMLIWQGTIDLLAANPLRLLAGYGPETLQTVYPRYYHTELARHAYRQTPVDRSHNETFDVLVTTGLFGFGVYLFFIAGIFFWGWKKLGFLATKRNQRFLLWFMMIGGIAGILLPRWAEGTYRLSGSGLPLGLIWGALIYLIFFEILTLPEKQTSLGLKRPWIFMGLFSALVAHLIEIQFGIPVAGTRLFFWIYLAMWVLLGLNRFGDTTPGERVPSPGTGPFPSGESSGILSGSLLVATGLFFLGFVFIHNPTLEKNWLRIIQISFTTLGLPGNFQPSYGVLGMVLLFWVLGGVIMLAENQTTNPLNQRNERRIGCLWIYIYITTLIFIISAIIHALNVRPGTYSPNIISYIFVGMSILILLLAWSLLPNSPFPGKNFRKSVLWTYPILAFFPVMAIYSTSVNPIKADIYFKQGQTLKGKKSIDSSLLSFRQAVALSPDQQIYHAELGGTLMIKAGLVRDPKEKGLIFEDALKSLNRARQINPLNAEPYSLLGYLFYIQGEMDSSPEGRREKLNQSHFYYQQAAHYAPRDILVYNLWARVYASQGDFEGALEKVKTSLALYPRFGPTYSSLGEIYFQLGKLEEAEKAYRQAIALEPKLSEAYSALGYIALRKGSLAEAKDLFLEALWKDPQQPKARRALGLVYLKSGQLEEAMEENLEVLRLLPDDLSSHNNLAIIYHKMGRREEALIHAQKAFDLAPEKEKPMIQSFINQLKEMGSPKKLK